MANDRLIFEVVAEGKGLKVVQKDVNAVADGVERADTARKKAGKGQDSYHKREKALYQSGLSSSKAFSKQAGAIGGGSSGLVGAYATLAANVFAATAAFQVFKEAAAFENLIAGLNAVGATAGRNLTFASEKLVEVSGYAISTERAMRSMALGVSSGFSTDQMSELTKVARGASLALGRDMGDAMDRLTRGAAKLEPEILDELGIMVRLDDATEKYAATIGKSAGQLSQFERRQAFLNAILEQGDKKFGQIAESIDTNPYDKLSASLANLQKTVLTAFNKVLGPMIGLLSENLWALGAALMAFGSTIAKQMIPGLTNMSQGMADSAKRGADLAKTQAQNLDVSTKLPKAYRDTVKSMDAGNISAKDYSASMNSLAASDRGYLQNMANKEKAKKQEGASYQKSKLGVEDNNRARIQLTRTYKLQQVAAAKQSMANAVEASSQQGLRAGFRALSISIKETSAAKMVGVTSAWSLRGAWAMLQTGALATAGAVKVLGAAVMTSLGWISMVASLAFMLYELFKDHLFPTSDVEANAAKVNAALGSVKDTAEAFQKTADTDKNPASVAVAGYKALQGVLIELQGAMLSNVRATKKAEKERSDAVSKSLKIQVEAEVKAQATIDRLRAQGAGKLRLTWDSKKAAQQDRDLKAAEKALRESAAAQKNIAEKNVADQTAAAEELKKNLLNNIDTTVANIKSSDAFGKFSKNQIDAIEALKKEIGTLDEAEIKKRFAAIVNPIGSIVSAFEGARDAASQFSKEVNKLGQKAKTPYDAAIDAAKGMQSQFKQLNEEGYLAGQGNEANLTQEMKDQRKLLIDELKKQMGVDSLGIDNIDAWVQSLDDARQTIINTQAELKRLGVEQKRFAGLAKKIGGPAALKAQLNVEKQISQTRVADFKAKIEEELKLRGNVTDEREKALRQQAKETGNYEKLNTFLEKREEVEKDIVHLRTGLAAETARQAIEDGKETLKLEIAREEQAKKLLMIQGQALAAQKQTLNNTMKLSEMEMQLANAKNRGRALSEGIDLRPSQQLKQFHKFAAARMKVAISEYQLTLAKIKVERALLNAKTKLLEKEIQLLQKEETEGSDKYKELQSILNDIGEIPGAMTEVFEAQERAARTTLQTSLKSLDVEREKLRLANLQTLIGKGGTGGLGAGKGAAQFGMDIVSSMEAAEAQGRSNYIKARMDAYGGPNQYGGNWTEEALAKHRADFLQAVQDDAQGLSAGDAFGNLGFGDEMMAVMSPMASMFQQLSEMGGPNANLMGAMGQNIGTMGAMVGGGQAAFGEDSLANQAKEDGGPKGGGAAGRMQQVAGGVAVVAGALSQVYRIKAAKTADQIAAIDKEIAAVKKLGLTTEQKDKRIMALEKKKEALKKKQFNDKKKMMMAEAVMGIALGIINALSLKPPFNFIMAAVVAAMGAVQLAVISGMSYSGGGGGATAPGKPSSVSMGERKNKVDVARAGNVAGELAYMRGERGVGKGASDFTPAFTGYRHRATGGAAYMVGEQGPELFVPEVPGQIVANDEIGVGGTPITANFTINTIDSSTMEETLTVQRGNIINMIREAANSSGEPFLESVDTLGLQTEEGVA